jgi:mannose-6-phosphate isomerase
VLKRSHRVWPHTEAIKATAARRADGDHDALPFAPSMARGLLGSFMDKPFRGGWADHVDATGVSLVDYVPPVRRMSCSLPPRRRRGAS